MQSDLQLVVDCLLDAVFGFEMGKGAHFPGKRAQFVNPKWTCQVDCAWKMWIPGASRICSAKEANDNRTYRILLIVLEA